MNVYHISRDNSIDLCTYAGYILRIDYWDAEKNLKTTPGSECALNAFVIDNPIEYARLYLDGTMQMWIDAEDLLELWSIVFESNKAPDDLRYHLVLSL